MYIVSNLVRVTIPNYLAGLPIPDSIGGWFKLGGKILLVLLTLSVKCYKNRFPVTNCRVYFSKSCCKRFFYRIFQIEKQSYTFLSKLAL